MPYVGMIYNPGSRIARQHLRMLRRPRPRCKPRFMARLYRWRGAARWCDRQAGQVGLGQIFFFFFFFFFKNGLEPSLLSHFRLIETVIIDFWHVSDRLGGLARTLHPNDKE